MTVYSDPHDTGRNAIPGYVLRFYRLAYAAQGKSGKVPV